LNHLRVTFEDSQPLVFIKPYIIIYDTDIQSEHKYVILSNCPTCYRTRHFFNNFAINEDIATKFEADLPHCVRNEKEQNVLLFKFRYIFTGVRIITEMPGSVASGTLVQRTNYMLRPLLVIIRLH
jgi:hypothetical protein